MSKPEVKVSVVSDYICPFCFIGHKRLNRLREFYDLKINWCFVEIHPETPAEGQSVSKLNYSPEYWDSMMTNLHRLAEEEGIQLSEHTMTTNSRKALLLAEASKSLGAEPFYSLHEKLFEAYFVEGQNIGDEKVLRKLAKECEIPGLIIDEAWSDPHTHGPEDSVPKPLLAYLQYAGAIKASSVPTFVFNTEMLTGVVDTDTLKKAAEKVLSSSE
jgi:predicted DsbA family dithiol-disulfide isomerase